MNYLKLLLRSWVETFENWCSQKQHEVWPTRN